MRSHLPLNALRAFEASARHLNFRLAGIELHVTQAAVSQQVRRLEERLGVQLFRRLPRGLGMTDEARALLPAINDAFGRIDMAIKQFESGHWREVLTLGVVGTFAVGWLLPRLKTFQQDQPFVDLRLHTHNNLVDLSAEGLDFAIRFGEGAWPGLDNQLLMQAPLTALCAPEIGARLRHAADLQKETLLRSYREDEWTRWMIAAGVQPWTPRGPTFDASRLTVEAAVQGAGVALVPAAMFQRELMVGTLVRPFVTEVHAGDYWLSRMKSHPMTRAMRVFEGWLLQECAATVLA